MFRNLLALIGLACILFVTVGFAMKWYTFSREEGKLTILIFTDRVEDGLGKIKDGAVELKNNITKALTKPEDTAPKQEPASFGGLFTPTPKPAPQPTGLPPASLPMPPSGR